jgi:hypothetical protein
LSLLEHLERLLQREPKFDGCVIEIGRDGACLLVLVGGELLRTRVRRFDSDETLAAAVRSEWAVIAANASAAPIVAIAPGEAASGVGARIGAALGASRIIALTAAAKQRRSWLGPRFDVDFGRDRMRTPLAAWALAVGALLACVATAAWLEPAWRLHGRLAMQQAEAVRLSHDTGLHGPAARASAALARDAEAGTQASVLMRDLQVPWAQLFDRLEASQIPKVHLVSVQIGHGFSGLQILAEAASLDDLLAYTKQLPGGPIAAARLTHHEWQDEGGPRYLLASIQADLKAIPVQ